MSTERPVFLDSHSTTPVDPRVVEAMLPWFTERFGNAASTGHAYGWEATEAVDRARGTIASILGAEARDIVFTSGATESNNLAIKGAAEGMASRGNHIVTVATEHRSVLDPARWLARTGCEVTVLTVDGRGHLDPEAVRAAITPRTVLVSVMHANNETGVIHDLAAIGAVCAERGVALHTDASQSVGKIPVNVGELGVSMLSLSGHKVYAPKGIGVLVVRRRPVRAKIEPQQHGGGHERGLRSGTLNVPSIVGLERAMEICRDGMAEESARLGALRDRLRGRLMTELDGVAENGDPRAKLPHSLNLAFRGVESSALLNAMPGLAVSTGSACSSAEPEPSHVLMAMGCGEEHTRSSLRFGLSRFTTPDEIERAADIVVAAVRALRALAG